MSTNNYHRQSWIKCPECGRGVLITHLTRRVSLHDTLDGDYCLASGMAERLALEELEKT